QPKLFYKHGTQATLDPLAAQRPGGGTFLWSEQRSGGQFVVGGHPAAASRLGANSSAAAMLAYDIAHRAPWDWRVSLYTVTKAIAAGAYLVPLLLLLAGRIAATSPLWLWGAPIVGLAFLAVTGGLLISDLTHPWRFYLIFTRPQWRSWLARGSFLIAGYGLVLTLHLGAAWSGGSEILLPLALAGAPLALATAIYTAFLFAQAKARDLWQSALLPPHMAVQTVLAGAGTTLLLALAVEPNAAPSLYWTLFLSVALHLLLLAGEVTLPHGSAHTRLAVWEMTSGRFRGFFRVGGVLLFAALAAASVAPNSAISAAAAALAALVGLLAHEHAYVQAGQSVPLA
ncbi:MAG: NrfD/PsrC family molybdoenzyme membrane anchor subunit, partial [Thermoanaerobaculia bacterium]